MRTRKKQKRGNEGQTKTRKAKGRRLRVPPPESNVWPEEYRGANWKPVYAILFAGRCQLCAYASPLPQSRQLRDKWMGATRLLLCTNHPAHPGSLQEVLPTDTCRNFKAKTWLPPRAKPVRDRPAPMSDLLDPKVRRIPLGNNLFAIVDARDYKKLCKHRWYASRHGPNVYARCREKGKDMYMHRMIMRPRKGYVVDHIDHNGLNNRRCNLRVCTPQQHQANRGPCGGTSRFVGVFRSKDNKWQAGIQWHGHQYYLGVFDDEVEAAKARDLKAYELNREHAYLNFPEDLPRYRRMLRALRNRVK
jgi:hypothetical protein